MNQKNKRYVLWVFIAIGIGVFGGELSGASVKANVGILKFQGKGVSSMEAEIASDIFRNELVAAGVFQVLDRNNMDEILKEQSFQQSGCTDSACAVKLGKLLNMQYMINGTLLKVGSSIYIAIEMINVENGKIEKSAREKIAGMDGLESGIKKIVTSISGRGSQKTTSSYLTAGNGMLSISSRPDKADVYIDGEKAGKTPFLKEIEAGNHAIVLRRRGYIAKRFRELIEEGQTKEVSVTLTEGIGFEEAHRKMNYHERSKTRNVILSSAGAGMFAVGFTAGTILKEKGVKKYDEEYSLALFTDDATRLGDQYTKLMDTANVFYSTAEAGLLMTGVFAAWLVVDMIQCKKYEKIYRQRKKNGGHGPDQTGYFYIIPSLEKRKEKILAGCIYKF